MKTPPEHLSRASKALFRSITSDYLMEDWHVRLLVEALQALDRAEECRRLIGTDLTVPTKAGEPKANPLLLVERDSRASFARLIKQLGLEREQQPPTRK